MKCRHLSLEFEVPDVSLKKANAVGFRATQWSYVAKKTGRLVFDVEVSTVEPLVERVKKRGIFCDDSDTGSTAEERVVRILKWFIDSTLVEPVQVVDSNSIDFKYRLTEGCHRFHCALAIGYTKVPATYGFDMSKLDA